MINDASPSALRYNNILCCVYGRAMVFIVLVPSVTQTGSMADDSELNRAGFVCLVVLQSSADLMLLLALDHEQRFRSPGRICTFCVKEQQNLKRFICLPPLSLLTLPLLSLSLSFSLFSLSLSSLFSLPLLSLSLSPSHSDFATLNSSPYSHTCLPVTCRRVMCSWYRVPAIITVLLPLILLAAVEIVFEL